MPLPTDERALALSRGLLERFDAVNGGEHAGYRPAHAKGIMLTGTFNPAAGVSSLTSAPHTQRETPVTVRLSDFAGIPTIPDTADEASPRGFAIRFHLGPHKHTDIVSHSVDNFPTRTAHEFGEFLAAVAATTPDQPHPNPIERFLGSHPNALKFVQTPKPIPDSFAHESFFAVSAFKFTAADGSSRFGRYRILPEAGSQYFDAKSTAAQAPDFLFTELRQRISQGPVKYRILVQIAEPGDVTDDATVRWPETRKLVEFGEVVLNAIAAEDGEHRRIIFDPIPRVAGIEASADPLFDPRADLYLLSGRRRRSAEEAKARAQAS